MTAKMRLRVAQLRAIHELMLHCNDEEIYFEWIEIMPDVPHDSDLELIAESDESYNELFDLFVRLISFKDFRI